MKLTIGQVRSYFWASDYERGFAYYNQGRVGRIRELNKDDWIKVSAVVRGTHWYDVAFRIDKFGANTDEWHCNCPRFEASGTCKHIAAVMIAYAKGNGISVIHPSKEDSRVDNLLGQYLGQEGQDTGEKARLALRLIADDGEGYPVFTLRVGFNRMYVIKNIREFLTRVHHRETASYGKWLTLFHGMEQFDEPSRALIEILLDIYPEFRSFSDCSYYGSDPYYIKDRVILTGHNFDRLFDRLLGQEVETMEKDVFVRFLEKDPSVSLHLTKKEQGALFSVSTEENIRFFGSDWQLYVFTKTAIMRCSQAFRKQAYPLMEFQGQRVFLSPIDLPVFCGSVLPAVRELVQVDDPQDLAEEFLPDECIPCFYFDLVETRLSAVVKFRYNEKEIVSDVPVNDTPGIKRDLAMERETKSFVAQYLQQDEGGFYLEGDEPIYDFLTDIMEKFREMGEVFVANRLLAKRVVPARTKAGISVSHGILFLDLDTGDFPLEELEDLYQSLLKRKKYYKLRDGRYLGLDGSSYETIAEAAHMLRLSPKELKAGRVELPVYRALYLDSVLSDNENIALRRDKNLRAMIRNFKAVSESDYVLPEGLENVLRPYQKIGFQWLKTLENCGFGGILADEMGLGKTIQVIAFFITARRAVTNLPSLVVCPTSLILNWGGRN